MDTLILLLLAQDGIVNGAIYALVALSLVLVFAVTRVILIPQGEFVAFGALTLAALEAGRMPGTVWLTLGLGAACAVADLLGDRATLGLARVARTLLGCLALPLALLALSAWLAPQRPPQVVQIALALAIVAPLGPYLYGVAFRPLGEASVLVLLIAAVGVHLALTGLGLVFFGAEGSRTAPLSDAILPVSDVLIVRGQSLWMLGATAVLMVALYLFFDRTLLGKSLRATAVNRLGARLVGIAPTLSGRLAFGMAAFIGALSGILVAPITTIYYDTGFLVGLKGFVAAIIAGLASYPGAAVAALLVGLVESFASFYASAFKEVIVFLSIIPVLLARSLMTTQVEEDEE